MSFANRNFRPTRSASREHVFITGSCSVDASSDVSNVNSLGCTIAKVATGLWRITLDDDYAQFCGITVNISDGSYPNAVVYMLDRAGRTILIRYMDVAGVDQAPSSGSELFWTISVRRVADRF